MTAAVRFVIGAVLASALCPVDLHAQKIAVLHADIAGRGDVVRTKLNTAGLTDVTLIDVTEGSSTATTPTLADLQQYHAILTWSNLPYLNHDALGDTLAEYVDQGGGVVQAVFAFDTGTARMGGRWDSQQYGTFTSSTAEIAFGLTYVAAQPDHPIMSGLVFSPAAATFFSPSLLQGGSDVIAHWSNGYPFVATRPGPAGGKIAGVNLYPYLGEPGQLLANALRFVAAEVSEPVDGPSVALLAAGGASAGAGDVRTKLQSLRLFSRVDVIDASSPTVPALDTLMQYDALLTWSAEPYGNPAGLGDALADYVDLNRGVVQSVFGYDAGAGLHLEGRWVAGGYRPLTEGPSPASPFVLSLLPLLPTHPILSGVTSFSGGASSYHTPADLAGATTLVAAWSNGQPLVAYGTKASGGRVVGLNMYPPSSDARSDLWDATTQGAQLIANALLFAANHFPTADAGLDQTAEATSAAGVTFTLTGAGADADDDPLSYDWSGAVSATAQTISVDVPPPPAGHTSHTVTMVLTVSDGKGGEATDSVDLTVTDTVAPELHNVPSDVLTAEAASESGAEVAYGPVTATDAVDGDVPVTCSHSGVFPIGDTLVTCSATDSRGNMAEQAFTVRVLDASTPGSMHGAGYLRSGNRRHEFAFYVRESQSGVERGRLSVKSRRTRFVSASVDYVQFSGESVVFRGTGLWNGRAGHRFEVAATDHEGKSRDEVRITVMAPDGTIVAQLQGRLGAGRIRCFRDRH